MFSVPEVAQRGQTLLIVQLVCVYVALTVTALRILSKHRLGHDGCRSHQREDLIMYLAVVRIHYYDYGENHLHQCSSG